jgi:pilus assembly protein TadC
MIALSAVAVVAAVLVVRRPGSVALRLAALVGGPEPAAQPRSVARIGLAAGALILGIALLGGIAGFGVGGGAAVAIAVVKPRVRRSQIPLGDVPVVIDLVAGCLDAGLTLPESLLIAANVAPDGLAAHCRATAASLRAGAPAGEAWQAWRDEPALAPAARSATRTAHSGAALAGELRRTAHRLRLRRRSALQRKVRQSSVWLVVPLGVCFLPAFVLVAVVPVVVGLIPALGH